MPVWERIGRTRQDHRPPREPASRKPPSIPPAIEAPARIPTDARESPETVEEEPEGAEPRSHAPDTQEAAQPRPRASWWRRVLGR